MLRVRPGRWADLIGCGAAKFHLRSGELNANVLIQVDGMLAGTVSAEKFRLEECWWMSRLKLDRSCRGRGIAEQGLTVLLRALVTYSGPKSLRVCPGGYGSHLPSLMRWYRMQGFREVDDETLEFDLGAGPRELSGNSG